MIYVAAALVAGALVAMASGRVDPLLALAGDRGHRGRARRRHGDVLVRRRRAAGRAGAVVVYLTSTRAWTRRRAAARAESRRAAALGIYRTQEYELVGIQRWGAMLGRDERIESGDLLVFEAIARDAGVDSVTVLALVGTCVSFTLINPYSHQPNVMVIEPGGYTSARFARFGAPILAACLVTVCGVTHLVLGSAAAGPPR